MRVKPVSHNLDLLKSDLIRSEGVHASDIYGSLFKALDPKRYDYGDAPMNGELMSLGSAWEVQFEKILILNGVKAHRPPELMSPEGIAYSPDLIIEGNDGVMRLGEIKLTSMGLDDCPTEESTDLPEKFAKYLCQMKLYAYWLGLNEGWLAVMSIRKPYKPELRIFELTWTDQELQENWRMCVNHGTHEGLI